MLKEPLYLLTRVPIFCFVPTYSLGYNKDSAWKELHLDQELVMQMRRAYDVRPPTMMDNHEYWHGNDRRYRKLTREQLDASRAESLKDAADRISTFVVVLRVLRVRKGGATSLRNIGLYSNAAVAKLLSTFFRSPTALVIFFHNSAVL